MFRILQDISISTIKTNVCFCVYYVSNSSSCEREKELRVDQISFHCSYNQKSVQLSINPTWNQYFCFL